jgi:Xaa-Pro aminopeptidase
MDAREVKTPQELKVFEVNAELGMRLMGAVEGAVQPGVREIDVLAEMTDVLLRNGGEYLITRAVVSGPNTNPWNLEATDRAIGSGELVFVDTDAFGWEGYFVDLSRTFLCGDVEPTPVQRGTYRAAHDWLAAARAAVRPGMVICLEAYFGAEGEPEGVKLEDQVEVTDTGCRVQIPYPFSDVLLG